MGAGPPTPGGRPTGRPAHISRRSRRVSPAGLAATEALLGLVWLARPRLIGDGGTLVLDGLILAAGWWLGDRARRRREAVVTAQQRAAELERAREELARRAVTEERLRIARELHDVVAHSMSIIAVQSGVGVHVLDSQPEEARKALVAVEAPAARPWSRCGGCWGCSARRRSRAGAWPRPAGWPRWRRWPPRWPGPGRRHLGIWAGGLVLAAYGLGLALLGGRLVVRRDLS